MKNIISRAGEPNSIISLEAAFQKTAEPNGLLNQLLARGDKVSIKNGRLVLISASGNPVPDGWLKDNAPTLIEQIAAQTGILIFRYTEYSTGKYDKHLFAGVTLQFDCITTLDSAYVVFNCILTRARATKHGAAEKPLPHKHFRLSSKHKLLKFLRQAGVEPRRLSESYKSMHRLKDIVFTGRFVAGSKLDKDSLIPMNLTHQQLLELVKTARQGRDMSATTPRQLRDKSATKYRDKESPDSHSNKGFQPFSSAGVSNHGNKNYAIREHGTRVIPSLSNSKGKTVQDQSNEDWLREYEDAERQEQ